MSDPFNAVAYDLRDFNILRTLLLSHHGVKQCFHTMDVAASDWATSEMDLAGPTSAKSASLMKNATIFVAKRTKNWVKNGAWQARERSSLAVFFPSTPPSLLLQHD